MLTTASHKGEIFVRVWTNKSLVKAEKPNGCHLNHLSPDALIHFLKEKLQVFAYVGLSFLIDWSMSTTTLH